MTIALIDGDILLYTVGFSVEKKIYRLVREDGTVYKEFRYSKDMWDHISALPQEFLDTLDIQHDKDVEPWSHCLHNLKEMLNPIMDKTGAQEYMIFLSGPENFREEIATLQPYKGNRDPNNKPFYYNKLKSVLITDHLATISDRQEADDELGITQMELNARDVDTVICTRDKDLRMIPGKHYHFDTKLVTEVSEIEGLRTFYTQMLVGDTIDNIPGIKGIGPIKAKRLLKDCKEEEDMFKVVREKYQEQYGSDAHKYILETGRLLWIRRNRDELWEPPNVKESKDSGN